MKLSFIAAVLLASTGAICQSSTKMVIGYFPNWLYANYPVENIPFNKYTHINYAFAILNNENNLPSFTDDWAVESSLPKLVSMAHNSNTKVLLSVGGWTGSQRFSPMVSSPSARQQFIDWHLNFIDKYNTDGVDIDWEYPGRQAAGCNAFDTVNDSDNFLLLLKELRWALDNKFKDNKKEISMAVHVQPFLKNDQPLMDLKGFVPYFDHVNLMTYDINGAWAEKTGPNAPFRFEQGQGAPYSFVTAIQDWKRAGVPSSKITAGLAFYGRSMKIVPSVSAERNQFMDAVMGAPKGDSDDAYWQDPYCNKEPSGLSGIWKWSNLRKEGVLKDDFVTTGQGWQRYWDEVSQTPYLLKENQTFISYDDPQSLEIKVQHALCEDLAGVMVWDIHQDNGELLEVVNKIHNPMVTSESCAAAGRVQEQPVAPIDAPLEGNVEMNKKKEPSLSTITIANTSSVSSSTAALFTLPTTSSVPAAEVVLNDGQACSTPGQEICVKAGVSPQWLTCNFNSWLVRQCTSGLVCQNAGNGIYCDFTVAAASASFSSEKQVADPIMKEMNALEVVPEVVVVPEFDPAKESFESMDNEQQEETANNEVLLQVEGELVAESI